MQGFLRTRIIILSAVLHKQRELKANYDKIMSPITGIGKGIPCPPLSSSQMTKMLELTQTVTFLPALAPFFLCLADR